MTKVIAMAGLPNAGKTTFLAALYHLLENPPAGAALRLARTPDATHYLQQIETQWLHMKDVDRTKSGSFTPVELEITDAARTNHFVVRVPDLSGEEFQTQWERRVASTSYRDLVKDCTGMLLFVSQAVKKPVLIVDLDNAPKGSDEAVTLAAPFDPSICPHGVILVDLLQIVESIRRKAPLKLAIVVSAWDRVRRASDTLHEDIAPRGWLERELPLLDQFLESNRSWLSSKVFGVSAQGGQYETDLAELQLCFTGADRVIVQDGDRTNHDLSSVLDWVSSDAD